ncbi:MAG: glutamate racemase [Prevotellaceae bacterium]|jgi:glutamate racemase|nr:glutamate racemase [Prevotellaceae bacterium]
MPTYSQQPAPIGIFDSGYGGLTILSDIRKSLPDYDFIYLGDNARTPYGSRSYEVVYRYTLQCVKRLFSMGCHLVVLACNTASAKALRTIQQHDLPRLDPNRRVLGIILPTAEAVGKLTKTRHIGLLGTVGTVQSQSYPLEIGKLYPDITVQSQACPLFVPLIENNEHLSKGADHFVKKYINELLAKDDKIDTVILGCTHYPLLQKKIEQALPAHIKVMAQGQYVTDALVDYLHRHPEIDAKCTRGGTVSYFTTESPDKFNSSASLFLGEEIVAKHI